MGNKDESQKERCFNLEDHDIVSTMGNQGIRGKIFGLKIIMKEIN